MEISDADDDGLFLLLFVCCFSCWRCHLINPATPDVITILEMAIHDIYTAPTLSPRDTPRLVAHARRIIHPGLVHLRDFICEKGWTHFECRIVPRSASSKLRLLFLLIWRTYYFTIEYWIYLGTHNFAMKKRYERARNKNKKTFLYENYIRIKTKAYCAHVCCHRCKRRTRRP